MSAAENPAQVESTITRLSTAQKAALVKLESKWWHTDATEARITDLQNYGTMIDRWADMGREAVKAKRAPADGWTAWTATGDRILGLMAETMEESGYTPLSAIVETIEMPVKKAASVAKKVAKAVPEAVAQTVSTYKWTMLGGAGILIGLAALYGIYTFRGRG